MEDSILKCNICAKSFSGVVPYSQHMQSAKHLKKQKQVESEILNDLPVTEEGKLCCNVCDMKFSGVIPYSQHINGSIHHKNIRRQKLMSDLYANHRLNQTPQEITPQAPSSQTWRTNIDTANFQVPHSSHNSPFDMSCLHDELPPDVSRSEVASGVAIQTYSLWEKANDSASEMNRPQAATTEGRLKGCGICGIPFFESSEDHIGHLESDGHFVKKLMSIKHAKSSAEPINDSAFGLLG